jgi:hypothetical protein
MVRGWFTADLLGLLDRPKSSDRRPLKIAQPWTLHQEPASFPYPLLTAPTDHEPYDLLFSVLESLSLSYVMVGQSNNLDALRPYIILRDFGMTLGGDVNVLRYAAPNPLLAKWIRDGSLVSEFEDQVKNESILRNGLKSTMRNSLVAVSDANSAAADRKHALISEINELITEILVSEKTYWNNVALNKNQLNESPFWPTMLNTSSHPRILINALESLKLGIESFKN